jgi:hypothetical protein
VSRNQEGSEEPADVMIGAAARARRLRFRRKPKAKVETRGHARFHPDLDVDEIEGESGSHSERKNLPEEVEPGVTYRDVEVGWVAGAAATGARTGRGAGGVSG